MEKVIIAGCGLVGTTLGERLAAAGHEVIGLRRNIGSLPKSLSALSIDLTNAEALSRVDLSCDWAVYAAAAEDHSETSYRAAYVSGLKLFLDRLRVCSPGLKRVVFTSSTGVYGQDAGEWVDEDSPTEPVNFSGRLLVEGERVLRESGLPGVVLRLGGIYGPQRNRLLLTLCEGRLPLSRAPIYSNRIHVVDCARAIEHLLKGENPDPVYVGVDRAPTERNELVRWVCEQVGTSLPSMDPSSAETPSGKRCRSDRLLETGFEFSYPSFREGYGEMLRGRRGNRFDGSATNQYG